MFSSNATRALLILAPQVCEGACGVSHEKPESPADRHPDEYMTRSEAAAAARTGGAVYLDAGLRWYHGGSCTHDPDRERLT